VSELTDRLISGPALPDAPPLAKLCTNCAHFRRAPAHIYGYEGSLHFSKCSRTDRVGGLAGAGGDYCEIQRVGYKSDDCGPSGRYWQHRPPPIPRPRQWWEFWRKS
jgi:hypothetical protein